MPYAKRYQPKTHKLNTAAKEAEMNFTRLFTIIKKAGFKGYVGIEYEGCLMQSMDKDETYLTNDEGLMTTKKLIGNAGTSIR